MQMATRFVTTYECDASENFKQTYLDSRKMVVYHLAGTWSDKDYSEFQKKVADFEKIDKDLW